jgi:preprotein translocase subunit YajC
VKRLFSTILGLFLLSGLALGHEGERHIMGKVIAVSDNSITVETAGKEPKTVTVAITAQTKFVKSGAAASVKDLKVGDRVVIHADMKGDKLEAHEVRFGAQSPSKNP